MLSTAFCDGKAEECELAAEECRDPRLKREWLRMASEWRVAGREPSARGDIPYVGGPTSPQTPAGRRH